MGYPIPPSQPPPFHPAPMPAQRNVSGVLISTAQMVTAIATALAAIVGAFFGGAKAQSSGGGPFAAAPVVTVTKVVTAQPSTSGTSSLF